MATQVPGPEDGDRPEGPMTDDDLEQQEDQASAPSEPERPIADHPEEQNSG